MCFGSVLLLGENGRNFAGSFRVQNVREGATVECDVSVRLINFSGAFVQNAVVTIEDHGLKPLGKSADFQGSIAAAKLPYKRGVDLHGAFTVPLLEYQQWQRGAVPNMVVTYTNAAGQQAHDHVELVPAVGR
jgi:hypothetical protein